MMASASGLETYLTESPLLAVAAAFAGGVLTSFTPCVYPVIPIIVAYIGSTRERSKLRAFLLSLFYVIGMAVTYAALGAFAALTGKLFGRVQASPVAHIVVGNIILLIGLSLLGVFRLPLPSFLRGTGRGIGRKGFLPATLMGMISGFVTAPCSAAVLIVLLTFVASRQNVALGVATLFAFALGMGLLLIVVGTAAGVLAALPKSGVWLERIEKAFGWIFIILAEYFIIAGGKLLV
jgi:thiol:disulfide interchange protein DsbD